MKKIFVLFALLIITLSAKSQTTATANVTITLQELMSINVTNPAVNINISTDQLMQDVAGTNGVSQMMNGHLKIVSNNGFVVKVSTINPFTYNTNTISQDKMNIGISNPVAIVPNQLNEMDGYVDVVTHNLGTQSTIPLIVTTTGTVGMLFDVKYTLSNVTNISTLPVGQYSTVVTYSIEAN